MRSKKSVVVVTAIALVIIVALFIIAGSYFLKNSTYLSETKVKRMRAYYTAKAGMVHVLEELRKNNNVQTVAAQPLVLPDLHLNDFTSEHITYEVGDVITNGSAFNGCREVSVTVDYTPELDLI